MADYSVYTGEAMAFLQGYATQAFTAAQSAIAALGGGYTSPTIEGVQDPDQIEISIGQEPTLSLNPPTIKTGPIEPSVESFPMPNKPAYSTPAVPVMHAISIPDFVDISIPGMTATLPTLDFGVPDISTIEAPASTEDDLYAAIRSKLISNILDGGTMLDSAVENDIWNRDLERHEQALQDIVDKTTSQWAKFGFSLPDGLLAGNLLAINNEYLNKKLDRSREISIKQAEFEHTGLFKSIEMGIGFEKIAMDSMNEFARRRLEAAKANGDILIAVFKERVNLFNSRLELFKSDAVVFKTRTEAEIARAEVYKAKIGALVLVSQIDENQVKVYSAQISAIEQLVNIYNVEVKAVATQYEAEKNKIEVFKSRVVAYAAEVEALMKQYAIGVEGFKSQVQAFASVAEVEIKSADAKTRVAIGKYEADIKKMEAQARLDENSAAVRMDGLKAAAQAASNLAAGALSAIHAQVSDSYQNQVSHTY
jgi:hypothetical protein